MTLFEPGELDIDGFHVRVLPLNHPGGAFAFRIKGDAGDVVFATDHEFGNPDVDEALAAFCLNASAVILDAHFTPEELPRHKGWGHGSWQAVRRVRRRKRRRSPLALPSQAGSHRRSDGDHRVARAPRVSGHDRGERRGELRGLMPKGARESSPALLVGLSRPPSSSAPMSSSAAPPAGPP